jgi:hypothetical protein
MPFPLSEEGSARRPRIFELIAEACGTLAKRDVDLQKYDMVHIEKRQDTFRAVTLCAANHINKSSLGRIKAAVKIVTPLPRLEPNH